MEATILKSVEGFVDCGVKVQGFRICGGIRAESYRMSGFPPYQPDAALINPSYARLGGRWGLRGPSRHCGDTRAS